MFLRTDLSSSADNDDERPAQHVNPNRGHLSIFRVENSCILIPQVYRFSNQYGEPITMRWVDRSRIPNELALINDYIIGVVIDGGVYPLWNQRRNQIIVRILTARNVLMTPELHAQYDRYFTPFVRNPRWPNLY